MMRTRLMRLLIVSLVVVMVVFSSGASAAETIEVSVSIDNVVRGDEGEIKSARSPVSAADLGAQVGDICDVKLTGMNPGSEHDGNDLILSTNGQSLVAPNFEETKGKVTEVSAVMVLGEFVTFEVMLGVDGVSSGGLTATFDCSPATTTMPPPDETTTTTTHVDPPPSTGTIPPDDTTTTEPPPVGGVPTGGGACADGTCLAVVWVPWALGFGLLFLVLSGITLWRMIRRDS